VLRAAIIAAFAVATAAHGAARELTIPAGSFEAALAALSRQAGISVAVDDPTLWGQQVQAIQGQITPEQALRALLRNVGAKPVRLGPSAWRAVKARQPEAVTTKPMPKPDPAQEADLVVVTGSKRDLKLRDYPGTVELLDGGQMATGGEKGTDSIVSRLASLTSTYLGAGRNKLFIRGIADSSFTGPTQGTVGQYLGDLRLTYNAPDPDLRLYDIQSVEVLEGPQGTLYGAGSLGGIVRIVPRAPEPGLAAGFLSGGVSATQHGAPGGDLGGWANLPVGETGALRLVGYGISEGGYIDDIERQKHDINRTTIAGGRATLLLQPADDWHVQIGAVVQHNHGRDSQYADPDLPPLERASPTDGGFDADYRLASLVVEKRGDGVNFLSSSGLVRHRLTEQYDATIDPAMPRLFVQRNHTAMFTSENRLWRPLHDGYGWVVGASFTHNSTTLDRALGPVDAPLPTTGVTNAISELTGFAEGSAESGIFTLTAGLRFTHDQLSGSAENVAMPLITKLLQTGVTAKRSEQTLLPSASVSARLSPGVVAFVRYQEGLRPGGLAVEADLVRRFRSDHVYSVEGGVRFGGGARDWIGGAVSLSYARWSNIQADYIDADGLPSTSNIGNGRIYSLNGSLRVKPERGLVLEFSSTYNDSRVTDPSPAFLQSIVNAAARFDPLQAVEISLEPLGRIPNVARFTGRAALRYEVPLDSAVDFSVEGWARYVGKSRLGVGPVLGGEQGQYLDTGLTMRFATRPVGVTIGLTNLFDTVGNRFALGTPFARDFRQVTPLRPRTIRIGLDRAF
jgi:outer membrane receptor protein involved in Fe transport